MPESIKRFTTILRNGSVSVTVRKTKGRAIDAACGQLRRRLEQNQDDDGVVMDSTAVWTLIMNLRPERPSPVRLDDFDRMKY